MRGGHPIFVATTLVASALAALAPTAGHAEAEAPPPAAATPAKPSENGKDKPADSEAAKPPESGAAKPAEGSAEKPADEGARRNRLVSILGRELTNRDGDSGRVIDVLVDLDGRSGAVVVEFGGFMGIGSRKVAVDWNAMRFVRDGNRTNLVVDISREQIRDAAEYKPNEPPAVLTTTK